MLRHAVLNNGIFGIGDVLSEGGRASDDLVPVQYHLLPEATGCKDWITARVSTLGELHDMPARISASDEAASVEVMIPDAESRLLSDAAIDHACMTPTPAWARRRPRAAGEGSFLRLRATSIRRSRPHNPWHRVTV